MEELYIYFLKEGVRKDIPQDNSPMVLGITVRSNELQSSPWLQGTYFNWMVPTYTQRLLEMKLMFPICASLVGTNAVTVLMIPRLACFRSKGCVCGVY